MTDQGDQGELGDPQMAALQARLDEHADELARQRRSAIEAGRRKGGVAGAAMAGAMLAVADIVENKQDEDPPVVVEASDDPTDIDRDGLSVDIDGQQFSAPPLDRLDP